MDRDFYSVTEAAKILKYIPECVRLGKGTGGWEGEKRKEKTVAAG